MQQLSQLHLYLLPLRFITMSSIAILLVVISALLHASWNILGKSNSASVQSFFFMISFSMALLLSPFLLWFYYTAGAQLFTGQFYYLLVFSGLFQIIYLLGLGFAYKKADVGLVYPMARALPVLLVAVISLVMGQSLTALQWFGFVLITAGCLLVPLTALWQVSLASYCSIGISWAVVAALGTTGYSIIDKLALAELSQSLQSIHQQPLIALFYLGMQFWAIALPLALGFVLCRQPQQFKQAWQIKNSAFLAGLIMASTYGLVLYAMLLTDNVSLVVALRQISIVFGLIMAVVYLKEKFYLTRFIGCGLIVTGLMIAV